MKKIRYKKILRNFIKNKKRILGESKEEQVFLRVLDVLSKHIFLAKKHRELKAITKLYFHIHAYIVWISSLCEIEISENQNCSKKQKKEMLKRNENMECTMRRFRIQSYICIAESILNETARNYNILEADVDEVISQFTLKKIQTDESEKLLKHMQNFLKKYHKKSPWKLWRFFLAYKKQKTIRVIIYPFSPKSMKKILLWSSFILCFLLSSTIFAYTMTAGDHAIAEKLTNKISEMSYAECDLEDATIDCDNGWFAFRILVLIENLKRHPDITPRTLAVFAQVEDLVETEFNMKGPNRHEELENNNSFSNIQKAMISAVNAERKKVWAKNLNLHAKLNAAAQKHAEYMNATDDFAHTSKAGQRFDERINNEDYVYSYAGENIARGQPDIKTVMITRMNSPGHKANIIDKKFTEIGVGHAGKYWVQVFATPIK